MNGIKENHEAITSDIMIRIHFSVGDSFVQHFPVDYSDRVQSFMDWVRKPSKCKTWSWHVLETGDIHLFQHHHIIAVDIEGYWEPDGRDARWYERIMDKLRMKFMRFDNKL